MTVVGPCCSAQGDRGRELRETERVSKLGTKRTAAFMTGLLQSKPPLLLSLSFWTPLVVFLAFEIPSPRPSILAGPDFLVYFCHDLTLYSREWT